jgi:signal transduction histidine kinase
MKRVMEHIQRRPVEPKLDRVELGKLIIRAVSQCADRRPEPSAKIGEQRIWARADPDRLQMALYHAIRNAQDATGADGEVVVALEPADGYCIIRIADTGRGMDEEFVRERLFKPFDSTKGAQGMGIGAYQLRETVQAIGGQLRIESQPGVGTTVTIELKVA